MQCITDVQHLELCESEMNIDVFLALFGWHDFLWIGWHWWYWWLFMTLLWVLQCNDVCSKIKPWLIPDWFFFLLGLRLRPAYTENFYHVLPKSNTTGARKVLLLAGDAAISHHFWPGRGLNTGLKSAVAIVKMWQKNEPFCWYRLGSMVLVRFNFKLFWLLGFSSKTYMCPKFGKKINCHIWGNSWRRSANIQCLHGHSLAAEKRFDFVASDPWTKLEFHRASDGEFLIPTGFAWFPKRFFQDQLRQREMQGRSASKMRKEVRLPWAGRLLSPTSSEGQQFERLAVEQDQGLVKSQPWGDGIIRTS